MEVDNISIRNFLKELSIQELEEWRKFIVFEIKTKEEAEEKLKPAPGTSRLRREYEKRAPEGSPPFNELFVNGKSRPNDDGFEARYDDGNGIFIHAKAYVTWRLGDHDMFTDVWGTINGKKFNEKG